MGLDFSMNQLPLIGNFFENPNEGRMTQQMHQAGLNYQAYRPELAQSRMNALQQQASMFRPVNAMLGQMYGPQAQMDTSQLQNPMSNRMMGMGRAVDAQAPAPQMSPAQAMGSKQGGSFVGGRPGGGALFHAPRTEEELRLAARVKGR